MVIFDEIKKEASNYRISEPGISKIINFYKYLEEYNKKINLVSRKDFKSNFLSLLRISLWYCDFLGTFDSFMDVGSGGGFPAIIFKIFNPFSKGFLVESSFKKSLYLQSVVKELRMDEETEVISRDLKGAVHNLKRRKIKVDFITSMGFRKKEQIIDAMEITMKGVSFITGDNEIRRVQQIEQYKKFQWIVKPVAGKDLLKGVIVKVGDLGKEKPIKMEAE